VIKSSSHTFSRVNSGKQDILNEFLNEYRLAAQTIVNHIWKNGCSGGDGEFNVKESKLDMPSMLQSSIATDAGVDAALTGRALKCCITQCCGMIRAETEKQRKRLYILKKKKSEGVGKKKLGKLIKRIKENIPVKPNCSNINAELNSICMDIQDGNSFDGFVRLKSIFKDKREIKIPFDFHKKANELKAKSSRMLNSILISNKKINLRWEIPKAKKRINGEVVGADQGYKDVLNIANKDIAIKTPKTCIHDHSLESIICKVSKKKKGSNAFKRAKLHQKNFVNWSLNQLNLKDVKQINLEKIWNIGYKTGKSRKMSHWQNTLIRDKVIDLCLVNGVHFTEQSCTYKSQRCFGCGSVRKANRKGKVYECKNCGNVDDADENAARNHSIFLPEIPYSLRKLNLNRKDGFFWNPDGIFNLEGRSLQSLPCVEV